MRKDDAAVNRFLDEYARKVNEVAEPTISGEEQLIQHYNWLRSSMSKVSAKQDTGW